MIRYATTYLLILTLLIGEVHTYWEGKAKGLEMQNWILREYKPMTVQWNVKYASEQVIPVLYFIAMWLYKRNKINNATVIAFICFTLIDTVMYFYNFKTYDYGPVYFWFVGIWSLSYWGKSWALTIWKHIKHIGK